MDLHTFIPTLGEPCVESMQYYGVLGDYIGGFFGTLIAAISIPVLFFTWRTGKRGEYRSKVYSIFSEMIKTHEDIVSSLKINEHVGREVFGSMLSEFYSIYTIVGEVAESKMATWGVRQRIDIAYTFTFYGPTITAAGELEIYDQSTITEINNRISQEKYKNKGNKKIFSGHQNRLSHYYRNLFSVYSFIDSSRLENSEKLSLGKVIRSKTTNYEQALLALNIVSHLGREWEINGLVGKYKVIKNLPKQFLTLDKSTTIKDLFPYIDFEWQKHRDHEITSWSFRLFGITLYAHRTKQLKSEHYV